MSTTADNSKVKHALESAGQSWIFSFWGENAEKNLDRIHGDIEKFRREYRKRFGESPDPYALLDDNPVKAAAFFQIDTLQSSIEMQIMIWRILLGCDIVGVDFHYRQGIPPTFTATLRPPYSDDSETYDGQSPGDVRVLRHFGFVSNSEQLFFQGYHAVRDK